MQRSYGNLKSGVAEAAVKRLKTKLYRHMDHHNTKKYRDVLQDAVDGLNRTFNKKLGYRPIDITQKLWPQAWANMCLPAPRKIKKKVNVRPKGLKKFDLVRVSQARGVFKRSWHANFSDQIYRVMQIIPGKVPALILSDLLHNLIRGYFWVHECARVNIPLDKINVKIDKVVSRRKINNRKMITCSFIGHDEQFHTPLTPQEYSRAIKNDKKVAITRILRDKVTAKTPYKYDE